MTRLLPTRFRFAPLPLQATGLLLAALLALPALADDAPNTPLRRVVKQAARPAQPAPQTRLPAPVMQPPGQHALVRQLPPQGQPAPAAGGPLQRLPMGSAAPAAPQRQHSWGAPPLNQITGGNPGGGRTPPPAAPAGGGGQHHDGDWHHDGDHHDQGGGQHDHDDGRHEHRLVNIYHQPDRERWREGRWAHDNHGGYFGWWWVVGPDWYFYDSAVYPYPDASVALVVEADQREDYAPPPVETVQVPEWYYCSSPAGYYPQVASCSVDWTPVPASAPDDNGNSATASYWYYCSSPQGYYPYVQRCNKAWTAVTPTVDQAATAPQYTAAPAPAPVQPERYWYYCQDPAGYYPTVPTCKHDWIPVPDHH